VDDFHDLPHDVDRGIHGGRRNLGKARLAAVPQDHGHQVLVLQGPDCAADGGVVEAIPAGDLGGTEALAQEALQIVSGDGPAPARGAWRALCIVLWGWHTCTPCLHVTGNLHGDLLDLD
jgi:hypothetical protein